MIETWPQYESYCVWHYAECELSKADDATA